MMHEMMHKPISAASIRVGLTKADHCYIYASDPSIVERERRVWELREVGILPLYFLVSF